jgi:hypothetical protein
VLVENDCFHDECFVETGREGGGERGSGSQDLATLNPPVERSLLAPFYLMLQSRALSHACRPEVCDPGNKRFVLVGRLQVAVSFRAKALIADRMSALPGRSAFSKGLAYFGDGFFGLGSFGLLPSVI